MVAGRQVGDDIAIMMVEAGGSEKAWSYYEAGAPKVTEEVIAGGLEACKVWIREAIDLQNELVGKAGVREALVWESQLDYGDDVAGCPRASTRDRLAEANTIADKTERNAANDALKAEILGALTGDGSAVRRHGA